MNSTLISSQSLSGQDYSSQPLSSSEVSNLQSLSNEENIEETESSEFSSEEIQPANENRRKNKLYSSKKKCYATLSKENLQRLKAIYAKNVYPTKEEFKGIAKDLGFNLLKIENWFKHRRRTQIQKGLLDIRKKRMFTKEENTILKKAFANLKKVPLHKYQEMALELGCQVKNIKNWFAYQRKKCLRKKLIKKSSKNAGVLTRRRTLATSLKSKSFLANSKKLSNSNHPVAQEHNEDQIFLPQDDPEEFIAHSEPRISLEDKELSPESTNNHCLNNDDEIGKQKTTNLKKPALNLKPKLKVNKKLIKKAISRSKMNLRRREKQPDCGEESKATAPMENDNHLIEPKKEAVFEKGVETNDDKGIIDYAQENEEFNKETSLFKKLEVNYLNKVNLPSDELPSHLAKIMLKIREQEDVIFSQNMKIKELINMLNELNQQNRSLKEHYFLFNQQVMTQEALKYYYSPYQNPQLSMNLLAAQHNLGLKFL